MPVKLTSHQAKTQFTNLLARVCAGEEFIITKAGKPVALLTPLRPKKRVPGIDKGRIWMSTDFDTITEPELNDWRAGRKH